MPHILVAEDSRLSRRMVVDTLREAGHSISEAENGEAALELFLQDRPDCVVTDLLMPIMDGQELLSHIRASDSEVPVIVASADIQKSSRTTCEELGISGFLNKPVLSEDLLASVDAALAQAVGVKDIELNDVELDALAEVINIGAGRAANSLSEITGSRIDLAVPRIHISGTTAFAEMADKLDVECGTTVQQGFEGHVSGRALLAFPKSNAFELARIVGGIEATNVEMDEELCGVLEEIGNIFLNSVLGSIANLLDCGLTYTLPELCKSATFNSILYDGDDAAQATEPVALIADASFKVASRDISGSLLLVFETGDIAKLLSAIIPTANA